MAEEQKTHTHVLEDGTVVEHSHGEHGHHHSHAHTKAVLNRMSRAIGHMESIKRMIEDGRDCAEVLIQLSAVKSAINNTGVNEVVNLPLGQANVILQVTNKKAVKDKYKVAVVKREVEFSKETYNRAYNDFSQFIAANPTAEKMIANAEEAGYKLLDRRDLYSSEHTIGGVRGTKEALRWAFDKAKPGDVSGLYECGESDHMMVVGLVGIKPEGYRPLKAVQDQLRAEIVKDKKAEKIMADMKAANATSFNQYKEMTNAVSDSLKMVTFAAPAYVSALRSSEPLVGAYASAAEVNQLSAPIKGNAGVFVLQVYGKDKLNETFDAKAEEATLTNMHARFASRLMNDLYLKANVKDTRFLFF